MAKPQPLPLGKLPPEMLASLIGRAPHNDDPRIVLGPGIGMDCAVLQGSGRLLVFKAEPITFATDEIGWYAVQVAANDIATTGAKPLWYLTTLLLPEGKTDAALVERISAQLFSACQQIGVAVIGGHTEITHGLPRPILAGTLIGEVAPQDLITPRGAAPGDVLLLTKGVPIEAVALLAREFPHRLEGLLSREEIHQAAAFLYDPGISVLRDAQIACAAGKVNAMHDPTEGGLAAALWELSEACGCTLEIHSPDIPIPALAGKVCRAFQINPLAAIASGALLMAAPPAQSGTICRALQSEDIACAPIGRVVKKGRALVRDRFSGKILPRPERDAITTVYES
ncbi:MAG: AIR synthase family protein [Anaerolineaceae bacterium]|nr:AIR synthase family protein [Anaerolineaceae bacterium]